MKVLKMVLDSSTVHFYNSFRSEEVVRQSCLKSEGLLGGCMMNKRMKMDKSVGSLPVDLVEIKQEPSSPSGDGANCASDAIQLYMDCEPSHAQGTPESLASSPINHNLYRYKVVAVLSESENKLLQRSTHFRGHSGCAKVNKHPVSYLWWAKKIFFACAETFSLVSVLKDHYADGDLVNICELLSEVGFDEKSSILIQPMYLREGVVIPEKHWISSDALITLTTLNKVCPSDCTIKSQISATVEQVISLLTGDLLRGTVLYQGREISYVVSLASRRVFVSRSLFPKLKVKARKQGLRFLRTFFKEKFPEDADSCYLNLDYKVSHIWSRAFAELIMAKKRLFQVHETSYCELMAVIELICFELATKSIPV